MSQHATRSNRGIGPVSKCLLFAWVILSLATWVSAHEEHQHPAGNPKQLGTVHFPVSCHEEAQAQFQRAVAIQHSFWENKGRS